MTTRRSTYNLRLPASMKAEAARLAAKDGISLNQFVAMAVAKKISAHRTASYFSERRSAADWAGFDRIMNRPGGEPPRPGEEIPVTR